MSATCHEEGMVSALIPGDRARVTIERSEACHSCSAKGACQALGGQTKDLELVVDNAIGARPGDRVQLTLAESAVLKASATLYLLPALGLVGGAGGGWALAQRMAWSSDPASIAGAAIGLVLGLLMARLVGARLSRDRAFIPRLTAITGRAPAAEDDERPGA
jgi:sigma-E factor negative regulatory protein RseC